MLTMKLLKYITNACGRDCDGLGAEYSKSRDWRVAYDQNVSQTAERDADEVWSHVDDTQLLALPLLADQHCRP